MAPAEPGSQVAGEPKVLLLQGFDGSGGNEGYLIPQIGLEPGDEGTLLRHTHTIWSCSCAQTGHVLKTEGSYAKGG